MPDIDTASGPIPMADMTTELVATSVSRNHVQVGELPSLISAVTLSGYRGRCLR